MTGVKKEKLETKKAWVNQRRSIQWDTNKYIIWEKVEWINRPFLFKVVVETLVGAVVEGLPHLL